jgi:hypothetical protein
MKDGLAAGVFLYDMARTSETVNSIARVAAAVATQDAVEVDNDWNCTARATFQLIHVTSLSLYQKLEEYRVAFDNCALGDKNADRGYDICRVAEMNGSKRGFESA